MPLLGLPNGDFIAVGSVLSPFSWNGCQASSTPVGFNDLVVMKVNAALDSCRVISTIESTSASTVVGVYPTVATAPGRPLVFAGGGAGSAHFGPALSVDEPNGFSFLATLDEGAFTSVLSAPAVLGPNFCSARDVWWTPTGVQASGVALLAQPYFSQPNPNNSIFLATFDADGGVARYRRIVDTSVATGGATTDVRGGYFNGLTALVLTGRSLTFEGERLATDDEVRVHVIVLKE
jgi:hypothetical protein